MARTQTSPVPLDAVSQVLVYQENARGALKPLLNSFPLALYDNMLHDTVLGLYPQEAVQGTNPQVPPNKEETHKISRLQQYPLDKIEQHFTAIKTSKGA
eukprot:56893-Ditylum_brightwellii.AAC.1